MHQILKRVQKQIKGLGIKLQLANTQGSKIKGAQKDLLIEYLENLEQEVEATYKLIH